MCSDVVRCTQMWSDEGGGEVVERGASSVGCGVEFSLRFLFRVLCAFLLKRGSFKLRRRSELLMAEGEEVRGEKGFQVGFKFFQVGQGLVKCRGKRAECRSSELGVRS